MTRTRERDADADGAMTRALAAEAPGEVIGALLDAWRVLHHPTIAELVVAAARRAQEGRAPRQVAGNLAARQAQWMSIGEQRDPLDLDWLFDHFEAPHIDLAKLRLWMIGTWPDDPRVASGLLALCRTKPLVSHRPLWTQIFREIKKRAAHHLTPLVAELTTTARVTTFDGYMQQKLAQLANVITALPPPRAPDAKLLAELEHRLDVHRDRASEKTAEDFLQQIWAAPDDDGLRAVFADWLGERGDPRGELITLQLARAGRPSNVTSEAMRRERRLLADHGRAWMGPLEPVIASNPLVQFERGFLHRAEIAWRRLGAMPRLMTHPAWRTVREYRLDPAGETVCDAWLDHMIALGARRL